MLMVNVIINIILILCGNWNIYQLFNDKWILNLIITLLKFVSTSDVSKKRNKNVIYNFLNAPKKL